MCLLVIAIVLIVAGFLSSKLLLFSLKMFLHSSLFIGERGVVKSEGEVGHLEVSALYSCLKLRQNASIRINDTSLRPILSMFCFV